MGFPFLRDRDSGAPPTRSLFLPGPSRMGRRSLARFAGQFATLLSAGVPAVRALEILSRQQRANILRHCLQRVVAAVRRGRSLSDALASERGTFDPAFVSMVRAGEAAGALPQVLERLSAFEEKAARNRGKLLSAMTYPLIVLHVAVVIVGALMLAVVPRFEEIFMSELGGQSLPALTRGVLAVGEFARERGTVALAVLGTLVVGLVLASRNRRIAEKLDDGILRIPLLGRLVRQLCIARTAGTLGTLLASGVPMEDSLRISTGVARNRFVASSLNLALIRIRAGRGLGSALRRTVFDDEWVIAMIEVGEEAGALPEMLCRVGVTLEEEVDAQLLRLTTLLEPSLIVAMAVIVGIIVIALFLPIVRIIQSIA